MVRYPRLGSVIQVVAIVLVVIGIAIPGYAVYMSYQSSPYMVQIEGVDSSASEPVVAYTELSPSNQAVFDRLLGSGPDKRQSAQIKGMDLVFFANNEVQYQEEYYSFEFTYDSSSTILPGVTIGFVVSGVGGGLFVAVWFVRERRSVKQDTSSV